MSSNLASVGGSDIPNMFHRTLGAVWQATVDSNKPIWPEYLETRTTDKRFFLDVEKVDPGLWTETDEGNDIDLDRFGEGFTKEYRPIKFGKRLAIPEEIEEDAVYEEAYDATAMLARTWTQTQDVYAVQIIDDCADANVTGGDGVVFASASHPIQGGATYSNILSPAMLPSNRAIQLMVVAVEKMRGSNGQIALQRCKAAWGPSDHKHRLKEILKSEKKDDTSNHAINALKGDLSPDPISIPHMASTSVWGIKTNAQKSAAWVWKRKQRFRSTSEIKNESRIWVGSARAVVSWSNPRGFFFSLA